MEDRIAAKAAKEQEARAMATRATHVKWVGVVIGVLLWSFGFTGFINAVCSGAISTIVFGALHLYHQSKFSTAPSSSSASSITFEGFDVSPRGNPRKQLARAVDNSINIFNDVTAASIAAVRSSGRGPMSGGATGGAAGGAQSGGGATFQVGSWGGGVPTRVANAEDLDVLLASNRGASRGSAMLASGGLDSSAAMGARLTTTTSVASPMAGAQSPFAAGFGAANRTNSVDPLRAAGPQWNFNATGLGTSGVNATGTGATTRGFHMRFNDSRRTTDSAVDAAPAEWSRLGVRDLASSTARMREWVRDCLSSIATDIRACDRYFAERQMLFCDCSTSLNEMMEVPKTAATGTTAAGTTGTGFGAKPTTGFGAAAAGTTTTGFGAKPTTGFGAAATGSTTTGFGAKPTTGFGSAATTSTGFGAKPAGTGFGTAATGAAGGGFGTATHVKRVDYLLHEKARVAATAQHLPDGYKLASMIDRRLQLDALLMINLTFPEADRTPEAQTHRQSYMVRRIMALASQPNLAGYRHDGGDPDVWMEGLPTDACIIAHVLRYYHGCFARHIRLAHDAPQDATELSLCIGHSGQPYFFVRYRQPPVDKTYHTTPGRDSLFHALLLLTGIVATFHEGATYGGIFGVIDLEKLKLSHVL